MEPMLSIGEGLNPGGGGGPCGWIIILIYKTSGVVTITIVLPGNGWFSCKLNKTYCNVANFCSCFIVHSLGMGLFLLINGPALLWPYPPPSPP